MPYDLLIDVYSLSSVYIGVEEEPRSLDRDSDKRGDVVGRKGYKLTIYNTPNNLRDTIDRSLTPTNSYKDISRLYTS